MGQDHEHVPATALRRAPAAPEAAEQAGPEASPLEAAGNQALTRLLRDTGAAPPGDEDSSGAGPLDPTLGAAIDGERGGGMALPESLRVEMEYHLGVDLSPVRLHTGSRADGLNRAVQAEAFTSGADVFFSAGSYDPVSPSGRELIAHELTHVANPVGGPAGAEPQVSHPDDPAEVHARETASRISASTTAFWAPAGGPPPGFADAVAPETTAEATDAAPEAAAPANGGAATDAAPAPTRRTPPPRPADDRLDIVGADEVTYSEPAEAGLTGLLAEEAAGGAADEPPADGSSGPPPDELASYLPDGAAMSYGPADAEALLSSGPVDADALLSYGPAGADGLLAPGGGDALMSYGPVDADALLSYGPAGADGLLAPGGDDALMSLPAEDADALMSYGPVDADGLLAPGGGDAPVDPDELMSLPPDDPDALLAPGGAGEAAPGGTAGAEEQPADGAEAPAEPEPAGVPAGEQGPPAPGGAGEPDSGGAPEPGPTAVAGDGAPLSPPVRSRAEARQLLATPRPTGLPPRSPRRPDPGVQQWQQRVGSAIDGVPAPDTAAIEQAPGQLQDQSSTLDGERRADRPDYAASLNEAVPAPPESEQPLPPPEPDPVPAATQLLATAAERRLPDQSMPSPVRSPEVHDEQLGISISGLLPGEQPAPPAAEAAELTGGTPTDAGAEQADPRMDEARRQAGEPPVPEQRRGSPDQPITLTDQGPPGRPEVPPALQADMTDVLAGLLTAVPRTTTAFIRTGMTGAFRGGVLAEVAPQLGENATAELEEELTAELNGIATEAGIAKDALDHRTAELREQASLAVEQADTALTEAGELACSATEERGQEEQAAITGVSESMEDSIATRAEAASGEADEAQIERKATRLRQKLRDDAASIRANLRLSTERRERELGEAAQALSTSYQTTATSQARRIRDAYDRAPLNTDSTDADAAAAAREERRQAGLRAAGPTVRWASTNQTAVTDGVAELRRQLQRQGRELNASLDADENRAVELVAEWRSARLDEEQSWWDRLLDLFRGWQEEAQAENKAWEQVRNRESATQAAADMQLLSGVQSALLAGNQQQAAALTANLDAEQRAVLNTFLATGSAVTAVANGMLTRIGGRRIPELTERFRQEAESLENWRDLEQLGAAQTPGFNAQQSAIAVHAAVDGLTTDEDGIYSALSGKTTIQIAAIRGAYAHYQYGNLDEDLADDLSDEDLDRAQQLLRGDTTGAEVAELRAAVEGAGTDEDTIMRLLRNKTPEERAEFARRYQEMYGDSLDADLEGELSGNQLSQAEALRSGDVASADALALTEAMEGAGTDEDAISGVYTAIRADVEAQAARTGMTTAEMEAEIRRRNEEVAARYGGLHGGESLHDAVDSEMDGAEQELAEAYAVADQTAIDASLIRIEEQAAFDTDDDQIIRVLRHQHERAAADARRDVMAEFEVQRRTEPWGQDAAEVARRRQQAEQRAEQEADRRGRENMQALENLYDDRYSIWGPGALQAVTYFRMDGRDPEMARDLIAQGGKLTDAQELRYAVEGAGTDEDTIRRMLQSPNQAGRLRTKAELDELRRQYRDLTGRDLDEDVAGDVSGREAFDFGDMLRGEPTTPEERLERLRAREAFERGGGDLDAWDVALGVAVPAYGMYQMAGSSGLGQYFAGEEGEALDISMADAESAYAAYQRALASGDEAAAAEALARFERRVGGAQSAIDDHRRAVDSVTDTAATIGGIAAGIAVIVVSGGTLTPAVAAAAAAAAAATGIGVKMVMLGHAYGAEAMATDVAIGAVDVGAALLTAGVGNALLRTSALARLAGQGWIARIGVTVVAEGIENALGAIPSGMAGAMLDDNTWRARDPLAIIARAGGQAGGIGFATGAGLSAAGEALGAARQALRGSGDTPVHVTGTPDVDGGTPDVGGGTPDPAGGGPAAGGGVPDVDLPDSVPAEALGESPPVQSAEGAGGLDTRPTEPALPADGGATEPSLPAHERPTVEMPAQTDVTEPSLPADGRPTEPDLPAHERPTQQDLPAQPEPTDADLPADARPTEADVPAQPERTPLQEQIDQATGVDRGAEHARRQAELKEFYENQMREADATRVDVSGTRIDQMVDPAGNPMVFPDGSPYGYGVQQGFEVRRFDYGAQGQLTEVTMKVHLDAQAGVSPDDLVRMRQRVYDGVDQYYNGGTRLNNGDRLHVTIEFVPHAGDAHLSVRVEPGSGPTVQNRWFTDDNPTVLAHELGHQLGWLDEYVDPRTVNRGSGTAPGVRTDGTLMGDFWLRDANGNVVLDANGNPVVDPRTQVRGRHVDQLSDDIEAARRAAGQDTGGGTRGGGGPPTGGGGSTPAPAPPSGRLPEQLEEADRRIRSVQAVLDRDPALRTQFQGEARALQIAYGEQRDAYLDISPDRPDRSGGMTRLRAIEQAMALERRAADMLARIEAARTAGPVRPGGFDNTAFQERIRGLAASERVAEVEQTAGQLAAQRGWEYDSRLSRMNNRSVYRDPATGTLYAVDTQHGSFEVCNAAGTHQEEVTFGLTHLDDADRTGGHDLTVR